MPARHQRRGEVQELPRKILMHEEDLHHYPRLARAAIMRRRRQVRASPKAAASSAFV